MRYILALSTALLFSATVASAAEEKPTAPLAAPKQDTKLEATPKGEFTPILPATTAPKPGQSVIRDSGGVSTSSLIRNAPLSNDYVMGDKNASVAIVEYASMTCTHCAHFANTIMPEIEKRYISTGKVSYILRQFPLNEPALKAAMLLHCIGDQNNDKYYVFAKVLFDAQNKWAFDENYMSSLETIAAVGGVSKDQFHNCTSKTDREMRVLKLKQQAVDELKVPHTPYIFIGGEVYAGDRTIESVVQFIEAKLVQAKK